MRNKNRVLTTRFFSLCLLTFGFLVLYKGIMLAQKHELDRFLLTYDGVVVGHNLVNVFEQLGTKPMYDLELTLENMEFVRTCGLKSLPTFDDYSEVRVAVFPWRGVPHRFIFVFYNHKGSNVVAKTHCKM